MTATASLQSAVRCFESDRESAAVSLLRSTLGEMDPDGTSFSEPVTAVRAAIKGFERGDDRSALAWTRTALQRLAA